MTIEDHISSIIIIIGALSALIRYIILNSKCSNISLCCGLLKLTRDTQAELELQEHEIEKGLDISGSNK